MGCTNSKTEKNEALRLCKERRKFIKQAIYSRYAFAAAHVSYIESLKNIGMALRRYAEAEVLIESSLSTSATELDKTPSHSSYPSPSPSYPADISDSPLRNESPSQISPPIGNISYMRVRNSASVIFRVNPSNGGFVDDESLTFPVPPPPPPFEAGSWDFFDPSDDSESFRFVGHNGLDVDFDDMKGWGQSRSEGVDHNLVDEQGKSAKLGFGKSSEFTDGNSRCQLERKVSQTSNGSSTRNHSNGPMTHLLISGGVKDSPQMLDDEARHPGSGCNGDGLPDSLPEKNGFEQSDSKGEKAEKDLCTEREDPSEFITHRAKDFLSSIKDIEHRFFRASESGREISRMLEANKISVGYTEAKGRSPASAFLAALQLICCHGKTDFDSHDSVQHVTKVITWNRSTSTRSTSSRNPLAATSKDDADDSGSDFVEEFCMISGSHSSTLDRLYAWERKLYDEVKASESIRKEYDRKCDQLRHQFAKDHSAQAIDKTRAVVKDLHSRIRVALHSVDSISHRIEKMRDEELHPQLVELIQGLIRMWKAMVECHHAQYITISLAYQSRSSTGTPQGDTRRQIATQLQHEIECFGLSFADWVNSLISYIESLNGWLHNCIQEPQERSKGRRPFSPRRVLAPPIFVLCRDWSAGVKSLPSEGLSNTIKLFLSDLLSLMVEQQPKEPLERPKFDEANNEESESKGEEKNEAVSSNLCCIQSSLTKVLDRLNKYSEASLKMYEDIRQKSEAARIAYSNCKPAKL